MSTDDHDDPNAWVVYRCRPCNLAEESFSNALDVPAAYFAKRQCPSCGGLMHLESYASLTVE